MKKYYLSGTDEEVLFGDIIEATLVKDFEDGRKITRKKEFILEEDTLLPALSMGIIEESDDEDDDLIDFNEDFSNFKEDVVNDLEELRECYSSLKERVRDIEVKLEQMTEVKKKADKKK